MSCQVEKKQERAVGAEQEKHLRRRHKSGKEGQP